MSGSAPAVPAFRRVGFLRLSWPLLAMNLLTLLSAVGDTAILSLASPELNAAVGTANQILGIPYDLSVLFSIGALVVVSQLLGAGDGEGARRASVAALRANTALGLAIAAAVAAAAPWLVSAVNTPAELTGETLAYIWTVAAGLVFNAYIVAAAAVLRAHACTVALLVLGILVNVAYLGLQFALVVGLDLGAVGAALSTVLVRGVGVLVIARVVRHRTGAHLFARVPPAAGPGALAMARLSLPTVLENGVFNLALLAVVALVNTLGPDAINARSYALTLTALCTAVVVALAQGNETIVGWDAGRRTCARARSRRTLRAAGGAAAVAAGLAAALWASAGPLLSLFSANAQVAASASELLLLSILLLPLSAASTVVFSALRSTGDVLVPMAYAIAATFAVLLPLAWLLVGPAGWGLAGLWWALIAAEAVKAALLLGRWWRGRWASLPGVAEARSPAG